MKKSDIKDLKVGQEIFQVRTYFGKSDLFIGNMIVLKIESDSRFLATDIADYERDENPIDYATPYGDLSEDEQRLHGKINTSVDNICFTEEDMVEVGKHICAEEKEYEKAELVERIEHIDECYDYFLAKVKNKEYS